VERIGRDEWNFILNNGSTLLVSARADGHWLQLDAPLGGGMAQRRDAWQLLQLNQGLGGLSKLAWLPGQTALRVRAEIPLGEDSDLQRRLLEACSGLKAAAGRLHGEGKEGQTNAYPLTGSGERNSGDIAPTLQRLCTESGWEFTERAPAKLAVGLEARSGFYQAIVEEQAGGAVSIAVELTRGTAFGESSKRAIGALLLRASAVVKLARAVVKEEDDDGGATASFEALFQTAPCATELGHALSALAVACGLCGRAAVAMQDEIVARNYCAAQGLEIKQK
jgi:hypothetical protein